jgi:hypothetical protein
MSNGVEFDEDKYGLAGQMSAQQRFASPQAGGGSAQSKMAAWLIKKGIVQSETGAQAVLLVIVIINIAITFFVIKYFI